MEDVERYHKGFGQYLREINLVIEGEVVGEEPPSLPPHRAPSLSPVTKKSAVDQRQPPLPFDGAAQQQS